MNINKKTLLYFIGALITVSILWAMSGCEGNNNTSISSKSQVTIDSLDNLLSESEITVSSLQEEVNQLSRSLDVFGSNFRICEKQLKDCNESKLNDPIYIDTCYAEMELSERSRQVLYNKNKKIQALMVQIEAHKESILFERAEVAKVKQELSSLNDRLSNLSSVSPYYGEKVTLIEQNGNYSFKFQKVQPLMEQVEEITNEILAPTSSADYYKFGIHAGWGMNTDFADFSNYQVYNAGFIFRPFERLGLGINATYANRNTLRLPSGSDQAQVSLLMQYNFNRRNRK